LTAARRRAWARRSWARVGREVIRAWRERDTQVMGASGW